MRHTHEVINGELVLVLDSHNGDQGKGKVVDFEAEDASLVVRPTGSDNAGHNLSFEGKSIATHIHPSGIFTPGLTNLIGHGAAVYPPQLLKERKEIRTLLGRSPKLLVDRRTIVTLPGHRIIDMLDEIRRGDTKIGSTKKGVAPSFGDFYMRRAVRFGDFAKSNDPRSLRELTEWHKQMIDGLYKSAYYRADKYDQEIIRAFMSDKEQLEVRSAMKELLAEVELVDSRDVVMEALTNGRKVVVEGAQGFELGIWTCDYPNGTSSDPGPYGVGQSLHIPPSVIHHARKVAVLKAYGSKVGSGPMLGEFYPGVPDAKYTAEHGIAERLQRRGREVGSTSGRLRRMGALCLPSLHRAIREWEFSEIALTHLDCFDGEPFIPIVEDVNTEGVPVTRNFEWGISLSRCNTQEALPLKAQEFLTYLEKRTGIPVKTLSLGPGREDTIRLTKQAVLA